eukprot:5609878-Amphidinium_carterae.1
MLEDVAKNQVPLGKVECLKPDEVGGALTCFKVWKRKGCLWMPVEYKSRTQEGRTLPVQLVRQHNNGYVDIHLAHAADERLEETKDDTSVQSQVPRGHYVPRDVPGY